MAFEYPNQVFKTIGEASVCSRRACSYTPAASTTIRQIAIVAKKVHSSNSAATTEIDTIYWEIRAESGTGTHKPGTDTASLLSSGSFDFRYETVWKIDRPLYYTICLPAPLDLTTGVHYFLVIKTGADVVDGKYVFAWATNITSTTYTPTATVFDCSYASSAWSTGAAVMNLTLYVSDAQAGVKWNVVINGKGYMTPDAMRSASKETVSSGLSQSRGGQSEYSQMRYPYSSISQDSWVSGSGQLVLDDQAAYLYGLSLDTRMPNQMIIGPEIIPTGAVEVVGNYYLNGAVVPNLPRTNSNENQDCDYIAQAFVCPAGGITVEMIGIFCSNDYGLVVNRHLEVAIYNDVTGSPGTLFSTGWGTLTPTDNVYIMKWADVALTATLVAGTTYWIVVRTTTDANHFGPGFRVAFSNATYSGTPKASNGGSTWAAMTNNGDTTTSMYFRINHLVTSSLHGDVRVLKYGELSSSTLVRGTGTETFIACGGKRAYKWNTGTSVWDDISANICGRTSAGAAGTESQYAIQDGVFFNGKFVATQGYDYPMRVWDGTYWGPASATELLTGGDFTTSINAAWDAVNATLTAEASGQAGTCLKVANIGTNYGIATQDITVTSGQWYELVFWAKTGDVGFDVRIGTTNNNGDYWKPNVLTAADWTRYNVVFKATTTTVYITLGVGSTTNLKYCYFDTVSLKEAPVGKILHVGSGYMWASASPNTLRKSNNTTTWSAELTVGESIYGITAFANFQGKMLIGKEDGIWSLDANDLSQEYLVFREHADPNNCVGMCVWSGMLFIPVQNSIWRWQGSQYKEIGPTDKRNGPTKNWPNKVSRLSSTAPYLYASTTPINTTGWGGLLAYDGMGWHHITATNYTGRTNYAICVTSEIGTNENRIWWGEGAKINYIKLPKFTNNRYDWTSATYNMSGGWFVSSWFDGGVKDAIKFWNRLTIIGDIPTGTSIDVLCAKDGEEWESTTSNLRIGTLTPESKNDNGEYVLMFPDGMIAKNIQLILGLNTTVLTSTPRVKAFNLEVLVRQPPVYSYSVRVLLADNMTKMDGTKETTRTANDMENELERAEASDVPVTLSWPDKSIRCTVSFQRMAVAQYTGEGTQTNRFDKVVQLSVIEVT
jgi:hypothetical protein